jgi:Mg-chelatase subunit ChlD
MDSFASRQIGENAHPEHTWSKDNTEKIVQFYFQLVRTKDISSTADLRSVLNELITAFKQTPGETSEPSDTRHLAMLYKLIAHTRDIVSGKGERMLTYAQIYIWHQHFPKLANFALLSLVYFIEPDLTINRSKHQYGSWNDIKYFCEAIRQLSNGTTHELIDYAISVLANQLKDDTSSEHPSLAARHTPREKSKFAWVFEKLASMMYPFHTSATSQIQLLRARRKAFTKLRQDILAPLNRKLDTVQVKMADKEGRWSEINFNHVTSKTLRGHPLAWQNLTKTSQTRYQRTDRMACASNYAQHLEDATKKDSGAKVHGKRCGTYELVKDALRSRSELDRKRIDLQWEDNASQNQALGNFIAMVDTSASMEGDDCVPLYNALGIGIRIAEKAESPFTNRILTFNTTPEWYNLDHCSTFTAKVEHLRRAKWGGTTNFYTAMELILTAITEAEIHPDEVSNMVLCVLSDMQININGQPAPNSTPDHTVMHACYGGWTDTMADTITKMYHDAGMRSKFQKPYVAPHILFWNLRKTTGFPVTGGTKNFTMLSGYSAILLNAFYEKGAEALREYSPYRMIEDLLANERYKPLERCLYRYFA